VRRIAALVLLLGSAQAQWVPSGIGVRDESIWKGYATAVNCIGAGIVCGLSGATMTITVNGGGGGSGLPADPAACPAGQYVRDQDIAGTLTCAQVGWSQLGGVPATFPATVPVSTASALAANGSNCTAGQAALGVDTAGAAEGCWTVKQPATTSALLAGDGAGGFASYAGSSCSAGQAPLGLTTAGAVTGCFTPAGTYTLPDAAAGTKGGLQLAGDLGGTAVSPTVPGLAGKEPAITTLPQTKGGTGAGALTCSAGQHLTSNGTVYSCTADSGGGGAPTTAQYWVGAADATLSAEKDLSGFTGLVKNTAGTPSAAVAGDLPGGPYLTTVTAHALFSSTHSDVDTAATTAGDIPVRNAGNTQWTHFAIGGANTVLHGGATAPAWSGVSLTADAAANQGTIWQSLHGNAAGQPAWYKSPAYTMLTATWASSAVANTTGIVGTGATPLTSPVYAAAAPFSFRCMISTTRPATTNGPRYGVMASSGSITRISFHAHVALAATTETRTQLVAAMTANCAANCSAALTVGTLAQVMDDHIEGTGIMNASGTLSLYMAPSAAAANTAQIGSLCVWY
jgi:hypothetical protein